VVKPFTAAELVARVRTTLRLARLRGTPDRRRREPAGTAAVITAGRALGEALQAATDQTRALLGGVQAVTELGGTDLRFVSPHAVPAAATRDSPELTAVVRGPAGDRLGTITVRTGPASPPEDDARTVLDATADLLATVAQGSWQLDHGRELTVALQHSLLPESLPAPDGWELQARYQPAAGGAWYDVRPLPGEELLISIGQATGAAPGATVTAGLIRNQLRAFAWEDPAPALTRVAALVSRLGASFSGTLFLARLKPATGELCWSSAGHPAPMCCRPGEQPRPLAGPVGPPLGVAAVHEQQEEMLPAGVQLVLTTGGLAAGDVLRRAGDSTSAATLVEALLADVPEPPAEDIAVLAVRRRPVAAPVTVADLPNFAATWVYPLTPAASSTLRRDLRAALSDDRFDPDLLGDLLLAATEAVNNAVEHAQQPSRPEVEVRLRVAGGVVRIEVQDFGGWRERPPARDRGRGALLMNAYGEVRVTATATGTRVSIERRWAEAPDQPAR
jgi:anti-sigma regulatory factor (Ser/Thr protein kinase)